MENSWFPIAKGMIQDEAFRNLTPTEKLYFWKVLSEYNYAGGEFYKSDTWFAASLNLSVEKIRKARVKLSNLGYIEFTPGTQDKRGRKLATTYKTVKWADVPEGEQFSKLERVTFERLIDYIGHNFTHADVVCYVYISHLVFTRGGDYAILSKSDFSEITGMPKPLTHVWNLLRKFTFSSGSKLFDFNDEYRKIQFKNVRTVAYNEDHLSAREKKIESRMMNIRAKKERKEREKLRQEGDVFPEDLYPLFCRLYKEKHNDHPSYEWKEAEIIALGEPSEVAAAIENYFVSELPRGQKHYTVTTFIRGYKKYASM